MHLEAQKLFFKQDRLELEFRNVQTTSITADQLRYEDHRQGTLSRSCSGRERLIDEGERVIRRFLAGSGSKFGPEELTIGWMEMELSRVMGTYVRIFTNTINE